MKTFTAPERVLLSPSRLRQWEEITDVKLDICPPQPKTQPKKVTMSSTPIFGNLDIVAETELTLDRLLDELKRTHVKIKFTNAHGEVKEMVCTQAVQLIPEEHQLQTSPMALHEIAMSPRLEQIVQKPVDKNLIKVFSLDRQGWRSVRFERISEAQFTK